MSKRILVTGAGTGASNNLIRSLKAEDPGFFVIGCNFDRFILKHAAADRLYLIPATSDPRFSEVLARLATTEQIDLVIPTTDSDVTALSDLSKTLGRRVFLPDPAVIRLCQDKYDLTEALRARNIPAPETYAVTDVNMLGELFERFGDDRPIWCRARTGSRSLGAAPMTRPEQAQTWILYWEEMRGVPASCARASGRTDHSSLPTHLNGCRTLAERTAQVGYRLCPRWPRPWRTLVSSMCVDAPYRL